MVRDAKLWQWLMAACRKGQLAAVLCKAGHCLLLSARLVSTLNNHVRPEPAKCHQDVLLR